MVDTIYTIGYSGFSIDKFIETLKIYKVSSIIDVRSYPYSKHFPDYNKDKLEYTLKKSNIQYRNFSNEFGARQNDRIYYSKHGYLDFELFSKSDQFLTGYNKLCNSMEKNYTFTLMCAEKDPINCHRSILVSRKFYNAGHKTIHLLPNNMIITQKDIEKQLLDKYFPHRNGISLLVDDTINYLDEAYKLQNSEIGYKIEDDD